MNVNEVLKIARELMRENKQTKYEPTNYEFEENKANIKKIKCVNCGSIVGSVKNGSVLKGNNYTQTGVSYAFSCNERHCSGKTILKLSKY